jgi:hypothetical protein
MLFMHLGDFMHSPFIVSDAARTFDARRSQALIRAGGLPCGRGDSSTAAFAWSARTAIQIHDETDSIVEAKEFLRLPQI